MNIKFQNKKYKPLDLRAKKTRSLRRALKPSELNAKSKKEMRRNLAFPERKYALKM